MGELPDERIDLAERGHTEGAALQVAADEAIRRDAEFERRGARVIDGGDAVLLRQREDAEDATDADDPVLRMDRGAERPDRRTRGDRASEKVLGARRGPPRAILVLNPIEPAELPAMLAQELTGGGIEEADGGGIPLTGSRVPSGTVGGTL